MFNKRHIVRTIAATVSILALSFTAACGSGQSTASNSTDSDDITQQTYKPGKLTTEEFSLMKEHSLMGYRIIKEKNEFNDSICFAVLQHHEKMNGSGYPMGVSSDKIVPYAKILSVVDVYDALVTERPYKKAYSQRTAVEMVMSMSGELDINAMRSFLSSVILYPVDSTVELSNGEKARVVKNSELSALRPTVRRHPWQQTYLRSCHTSRGRTDRQTMHRNRPWRNRRYRYLPASCSQGTAL